MQSVVGVYNLSLARLGGNQLTSINSPDEDSNVVSLCNRLFPAVVDSCLKAHDWSFAVMQEALPLLGEDQNTGLCRYAQPADCIKVIRINGEREDHFRPLCILQGKYILTDVGRAILTYVKRTHNPDDWSSSFYNTVAWGLAAELAITLNNDRGQQQTCAEQCLVTLHDAVACDLNQQVPMRYPCPWLEAR